MTRGLRISIAAGLFAFTLGALPSGAIAQQVGLKEQLVGAWSLVSLDVVTADGKKTSDLGPMPNGTIIFDAGGHYALVFTDSTRPKWKSANRSEATVDDFKSAFLGTIAQSGTWSVGADGKTLVFKVTSGLNPNVAGSENEASAVVVGDELRTARTISATGNTIQMVGKRAK